MKPRLFPLPALGDYTLLDSGEGEKLERFGSVVLRRPDPQALWGHGNPDAWEQAHLRFVRESDRGGRWELGEGAPPEARGHEPRWICRFDDLSLEIRPTPFKHVGVFPEQAANWQLLRDLRPSWSRTPRMLNLFGYTGGASIVGVKAGYSVTHVDASKASLTWAVDNLGVNDLAKDSMRVICEDALAFARREVRRGSRYDVVLLDPPHYGRGPKGETWKFEQGMAPLVEAVGALLEEQACVVVSTYAIGFSPLALANLLGTLPDGEIDAGELALPEAEGSRLLPAGFCARWQRGLGR